VPDASHRRHVAERDCRFQRMMSDQHAAFLKFDSGFTAISLFTGRSHRLTHHAGPRYDGSFDRASPGELTMKCSFIPA